MKQKGKYILVFLMGILFSGGVVYAVNKINASDISFTSTNENFTATNVQEAMDELYNDAHEINGRKYLIKDGVVLEGTLKWHSSFEQPQYLADEGCLSSPNGQRIVWIESIDLTDYSRIYYNLTSVNTTVTQKLVIGNTSIATNGDLSGSSKWWNNFTYAYQGSCLDISDKTGYYSVGFQIGSTGSNNAWKLYDIWLEK